MLRAVLSSSRGPHHVKVFKSVPYVGLLSTSVNLRGAVGSPRSTHLVILETFSEVALCNLSSTTSGDAKSETPANPWGDEDLDVSDLGTNCFQRSELQAKLLQHLQPDHAITETVDCSASSEFPTFTQDVQDLG